MHEYQRLVPYKIIIACTHHRILKEALRSGGGQLTQTHVEDVSLAVLFLMEASKKADETFHVPPWSGCHTVVNSDKDIKKMWEHLQDRTVLTAHGSQPGVPFLDPALEGWKKLTTTSWLQDTIKKYYFQGDDDDLQGELQHTEESVDHSYELGYAT